MTIKNPYLLIAAGFVLAWGAADILYEIIMTINHLFF